MTATPNLEDRLRRGLRAAGEALPPELPALASGSRPPGRRGRGGRGRRAVAASVAVAATALVVGGVVVTRGDDGDRSAVQSAAGTTTESTAPPTTQPDSEVRATNGMVPGQAVMIGDELRTYGPDGAPTGTVDLSQFESIQAASSDLDGGWVVCGARILSEEEREAAQRELDASFEEHGPTTTATVGDNGRGEPGAAEETAAADAVADRRATATESGRGGSADGPTAPTSRDALVWLPAEGEPVVLDDAPLCMAGAVHVVDSPEGPTAVYVTMAAPGDETSGLPVTSRALVLGTGEDRPLEIPSSGAIDIPRWSVTSERFLVHDSTGLQVYDLATGEELPVPAIPLDRVSDVVLAGDGGSIAAITGSATGPSEVVVYDLTTGDELFRELFDMPTEGAELSYDGSTLAVGNYYEGNGDVTVIDLAEGARHTLEAHGLVL